MESLKVQQAMSMLNILCCLRRVVIASESFSFKALSASASYRQLVWIQSI